MITLNQETNRNEATKGASQTSLSLPNTNLLQCWSWISAVINLAQQYRSYETEEEW